MFQNVNWTHVNMKVGQKYDQFHLCGNSIAIKESLHSAAGYVAQGARLYTC